MHATDAVLRAACVSCYQEERVWLVLGESLSAVALTAMAKIREQVRTTSGKRATQRSVQDFSCPLVLPRHLAMLNRLLLDVQPQHPANDARWCVSLPCLAASHGLR